MTELEKELILLRSLSKYYANAPTVVGIKDLLKSFTGYTFGVVWYDPFDVVTAKRINTRTDSAYAMAEGYTYDSKLEGYHYLATCNVFRGGEEETSSRAAQISGMNSISPLMMKLVDVTEHTSRELLRKINKLRGSSALVYSHKVSEYLKPMNSANTTYNFANTPIGTLSVVLDLNADMFGILVQLSMGRTYKYLYDPEKLGSDITTAALALCYISHWKDELLDRLTPSENNSTPCPYFPVE